MDNKRIKYNKTKDFIIKFIIGFFTALTLGFFVIIISFTIAKGAISNLVTKSPFYPKSESVYVDLSGNEWIVIINTKIKLDSLSLNDIRLRATMIRAPKWGELTHQDIKATCYIYNSENDMQNRSLQLALTGLKSYSSKVKKCQTMKELINCVGNNKGGFSFIPNTALNQKRVKEENKIKSVGIRFRVPIKKNMYLTDYNDPSSHNILELSEKEAIEKVNNGELSLVHYDHHPNPNLVIISKKERKWALTWDYLTKAPVHSGRWGGIFPIIINSFLLIFFSILIAFPTALYSAITITCYPFRGFLKPLKVIIKQGIDTLSGIPSIIFGLFGYVVFVQLFGFGKGFLSGTLAMSLMILPTLIKTFEEAIKTVPYTYQEASYALGSSKLRTIFSVILPSAIKGIITGTILAIGRVISETAVLIFTLGTGWKLIDSPTANGRVLSQNLYLLFSEANFNQAFSSAAVLIIIILFINLGANYLMKRLSIMHVN